LTHPKYVKAIKGQKNDVIDSVRIADVFTFDLVFSSFIPPVDFRALRELERYRAKMVGMQTAQKNRYQNCLTVSNVALANVLTDMCGKTAMDIMQYVLISNDYNEEYCKKLIYGTARKKTDQILQSLRGLHLDSAQWFKITKILEFMRFLDQQTLAFENEICARFQPYAPTVNLLVSIPGISELSARLILSEIGVDMSIFPSSKRLVSWAGLCPAKNESANKKKSTRISKAGVFLKPVLVQCAHAAVRDKKNTYFALKYHRLRKRIGKKKAIVAIARMMLVCIFHMIQSGETFHPTDYEVVLTPRPRKITLSNEEILAELASRGFDTSSIRKLE
jgi:transposase